MSNRDPIRAALAALATCPAPVEGDLSKIVEGLKRAAGGAAAIGNMQNFGLLVRTIKFLEQQATELATLRAGVAPMPVPVPVPVRKAESPWHPGDPSLLCCHPDACACVLLLGFDHPDPCCAWSQPPVQPPQGGEVEG